MCHVYALGKGQLQYLVSLRNRFIYDVHFEFAGVVGKLFKFIDLQAERQKACSPFQMSG